MDNLKEMKKIYAYITLALILGVISFFASIVKNMVIERWAKSRDIVACIPTDLEQPFPMVYAQTDAHPIKSDAALKNFIYQYVQSAFNEQSVDYHSLSKNGRYDSIKISEEKKKAIEMSMPDSIARSINMKRFADSQKTLEIMKKCNCGWIFNIEDIIVKQDVNSGKTFAWVRGEYQVTYDNVKTQEPSELWGFREISLVIEQGVPMVDTKENDINADGKYVSFEFVRILSAEERAKIKERKSNYYIKGNR